MDYLSGKLTLLSSRAEQSELGNLALEILVLRSNANDILEGDYSKKEKDEAKTILQNLKALERRVTQVYAIGMLRKERARPTSPFAPNAFRRVKVPA